MENELCQSKMAAAKPEVPISQLVDEIATQCQRLYVDVFEDKICKESFSTAIGQHGKWEIQDGHHETGSTHI